MKNGVEKSYDLYPEKMDELSSVRNILNSDSLKMLMMTVAFSAAFVLSANSSDAEEGGLCSICNSGGLFLKSDEGDKGQGYLVYEGGELKIYTIKHFLDTVTKTVVISYPDFISKDFVTRDKFVCESEDADDSSCNYTLGESMVKLMMDNSKQKPAVRLREHENLEVGAYMGFFRPFAKSLSVAKVVEITDEYIVLDSGRMVLVEDVERFTVSDAFCEGSSGGPAFILKGDPFVDGTNMLKDEDGLPVSFGEVEQGFGKVGNMDSSRPDSECFAGGKVRRVSAE